MKVIKGLEFLTDMPDGLSGAGLQTGLPLFIFISNLLLGIKFLIEPLWDSHEEGKLKDSPQNLGQFDIVLGKIGTEEISVDNFL